MPRMIQARKILFIVELQDDAVGLKGVVANECSQADAGFGPE